MELLKFENIKKGFGKREILKGVSFNVKAGEIFELKGECLHHLLNVARIKAGEQIMVLNGNGLEIITQLEKATNKSAFLKVVKINFKEKNTWMDLALCLPKKEAYESILKSSVEMGISNIIQVKSEFSQKIFLSEERTDKIIETALVQSNNPYLPVLQKTIEFETLIEIVSGYDYVFAFSTKIKCDQKKINFGKKNLMLIGPEGGFSESEEKAINVLANVNLLKMDLPIMRAPTAVNVALGYLQG